MTEHWFDVFQTTGVVGGLIFTAHTLRKDERARQISNLIAINQQYREIWKELYEKPTLSRVLKQTVDLDKTPVSDEERLFVKLLILHLDTVYRATKAGMFVKLEGLKTDVRGFFALPIPKGVWQVLRDFQDDEFVSFVEGKSNKAFK